MSKFLGIDTSNYTTSAAIYDSNTGNVIQSRKLLGVADGERGIRQSNAVFEHLKQLPEILADLGVENVHEIDAVGVSSKPRNREGSYMPCFVCGEKFAEAIGIVQGIKVHKTSHQAGHMLAALYSINRIDFIDKSVLLFHVSGGTTECVLCEPDKEETFKFTEVCSSLDLKAGQLIDRVGVMLRMQFPCGAELEKLAIHGSGNYKIKPVIKDGCCCLSGVENICMKKHQAGEPDYEIASYVLAYISETILQMSKYACERYRDMPVIYAGGVMSDVIIRDRIEREIDGAYFAKHEFSCDNAVGTAVFASIKHSKG